MAAKPIRGIHVFWWIASFFALVIAADTYFVVRAVGTFPGEQVKNSYVLGLDYNHQLARREAQLKLGWTAEAGLVGGEDPMLLVRCNSDAGPLTGLTGHVDLILPGRGAHILLSLEPVPRTFSGIVVLNVYPRARLDNTANKAGRNEPGC